jgi:hypothetical protein
MSVEVWERRDPKNWVVLIDPFFDPRNARRGKRPLVTVASQQEWSFEVRDLVWQRAGVSWGSIGAVGADEAEAVAQALTIAAERARTMNTEHGFDSGIVVKGGATPDGTSVRDNATEEKGSS